MPTCYKYFNFDAFDDNVPVKLLLDAEKACSNIDDDVELMMEEIVLLLSVLLSWMLLENNALQLN